MGLRDINPSHANLALQNEDQIDLGEILYLHSISTVLRYMSVSPGLRDVNPSQANIGLQNEHQMVPMDILRAPERITGYAIH